MPAAYNVDNLVDDIYATKRWIDAVASSSSGREKWFTNILYGGEEIGNESLFVSNLSSGLRCGAKTVVGDVKEFWSPRKVEERMLYFGTYNLAGELSSVNRYLYPAFGLRDKPSALIRTTRSYKEACRTTEQ